MTGQTIMTVREAALAVAVNHNTIKKAIACGRITLVGTQGKAYLVDLDEVRAAELNVRRQQGPEAVWRRIARAGADDCWLWTGCTNKWGYGTVRVSGRTQLAHRVVFELVAGRAPDALKVCHSCDTPPCCNPAHLFLGTQAVNVADCVAKGRFRSHRGEHHNLARLTEAQVREIRRLRAAGVHGADIAEQFGITRGHASAIFRRRIWTHVDDAEIAA